jgi:DNA primase
VTTGEQTRAAAPDPNDPALRVERDSLKVVLQAPSLATGFGELDADVFTAPAYQRVRDAVVPAGGPAAAGQGGPAWLAGVDANAADDSVRALVRELAVEPVAADDDALTRFATEVLARLEELAATRRIADLKSRLQRLNPVDEVARYNRLFGELVALEAHRRGLRERAIGAL